MPNVPLIGRLAFQEYLALVGSFLLIGLEIFVRVVTLALPGPVFRLLYAVSRRAFNLLSSPQGRRSRNKKKSVSSPIAQASDFVELCELYGYYAEEHVIQTGDGYLLGVHRLGWRKGEEDQRVNSGPNSIQKKVVYLHHGLMMNSEVWVCLTEQERCLPFKLVDEGYDVWLGNNRGNKYSKKSVHHSPTSTAFWNFSMDQFAFHDIPDSIEYILSTTRQQSLSYIGFSQGTAQAFATLSIHPNLNDKVDVFIALAPAMAPPGLASGIVSSFVKASPQVLFLAFGRKAILSSTTMWQALLYPALFCWFIDKSLGFLFGWHSKNITEYQKLAAYPHLYSFSSTKCVVHWFQIISTGTFQMFDDEVQAPLSVTQPTQYYKVPKFPTRNIKTPIVLLYGGSDSLVDIDVMLKSLPKHTLVKEIPHYEHLDFLWASDVDKLVFPHVLDALEFHSTGEKGILYSNQHQRLQLEQPPSYPGSEHASQQPQQQSQIRDLNGHFRMSSSDMETHRVYQAHTQAMAPRTAGQGRVVAVLSPRRNEREGPASPMTSQISQRSSMSRPEGWWSSDDVAGGTSDSPSPTQERSVSIGGGGGGAAGGRSSRSSLPLPIPPRSPARTSQQQGQSPVHASAGSANGKAKHRVQRSTDSSARSSEANISDRGISLGLGFGKGAAAEGLVSRDTVELSQSPREGLSGYAEGGEAADSKSKKRGKRK